MSARIARVPHIVRYCIRELGMDVLHERPSQRNVQKLRSAANRQDRFSGLARRSHKSYFSIVAKAIHGLKTLVPGLAVERWIDVFASSENKSVGGGDDTSCRSVAGKRRYYQWYEPC
jgi:hypothetical protein